MINSERIFKVDVSMRPDVMLISKKHYDEFYKGAKDREADLHKPTLLKRLWALVYRRWLYDDYYKNYYKVLRVKGWRSALVERKSGERMSLSPCFLWFD